MRGDCSHSPSTQLFILLIAITALLSVLMGSGCGSGSEKSENLSNYINQINLDAETSNTAMIGGTIEQVQKEKGRFFIKVNISGFQFMAESGDTGNGSPVTPGTAVVVEIRNPRQEFREGQRIRASVHVAAADGGFRLLAEKVQSE